MQNHVNLTSNPNSSTVERSVAMTYRRPERQVVREALDTVALDRLPVGVLPGIALRAEQVARG